jgi:alkylated DNA repair dioxygenase AlkB
VPDEYWPYLQERLSHHRPIGVEYINIHRTEQGRLDTLLGVVHVIWTPAEPQHVIANQEVGADVRYWPHFLSPHRAASLYETLKAGIAWEQERVVMRGKSVDAHRLTATYGDHPGLFYGYSGVLKGALPWTEELKELKQAGEILAGCQPDTLNYAVLNYYRDGKDTIGYHADKEAHLIAGAPIVSISLGAERDFLLKHQGSGLVTKLVLASGSMLTMEGTTQQHYKHSVPVRKRCTEGRINITFRRVREQPPPTPKKKRARDSAGSGRVGDSKKRRLVY